MSENRSDSQWLSFAEQDGKNETQVRVVCIPNAGGLAAQYYSWQPLLGSRIECCAAKLPGREDRIKETPYNELNVLIWDLGTWLAGRADVPLALFGHSLGGVIAFELT
jgi:medium-chain acyl-[acyl-carrier-protein] hydrolase